MHPRIDYLLLVEMPWLLKVILYVLQSQLSSLHITFPSENEWQKLKGKGFLQRIGMQYHWKNRNYKK
jgi:predicted N-acyltransferase